MYIHAPTPNIISKDPRFSPLGVKIPENPFIFDNIRLLSSSFEKEGRNVASQIEMCLVEGRVTIKKCEEEG